MRAVRRARSGVPDTKGMVLAIVANALGKHELAARLVGAAAAGALDEETYQKAWYEGQAMVLEEALAYAREEE